jgi:hypothetical protein
MNVDLKQYRKNLPNELFRDLLNFIIKKNLIKQYIQYE